MAEYLDIPTPDHFDPEKVAYHQEADEGVIFYAQLKDNEEAITNHYSSCPMIMV